MEGSSQAEREWNMENQYALRAQKQREAFSLKVLKERGKSEKQVQEFQEKLSKITADNDADIRRMQLESEESKQALLASLGKDRVAEQQDKLNYDLSTRKISSETYLAKLKQVAAAAKEEREQSIRKMRAESDAYAADLAARRKSASEAAAERLASDKQRQAYMLAQEKIHLKEIEAGRVETRAPPPPPPPPPPQMVAILDPNSKAFSQSLCKTSGPKLSASRSLVRSARTATADRKCDWEMKTDVKDADTLYCNAKLSIMKIETFLDENGSRLSAEEKKAFGALRKKQVSILNAARKGEPVGKLLAEEAKTNYSVLKGLSEECLSSAQSVPFDNADGFTCASVDCVPDHSDKRSCSMYRKGGEASLLKPFKKCRPNFYPQSGEEGKDMRFREQCANECNLDLRKKRKQAPSSEPGSSQLVVFSDGNTCGCPADMRFRGVDAAAGLDAIRSLCVSGQASSSCAGESHCDPMYAGANCNNVDTVCTSARREEISSGKSARPPEERTFRAVCPEDKQYENREACAKGSACRSDPNPYESSPSGSCPSSPNAMRFAGEECDRCAGKGGAGTVSEHHVIRKKSECGNRYMCECSGRFSDKEACGSVYCPPQQSYTPSTEGGVSSASKEWEKCFEDSIACEPGFASLYLDYPTCDICDQKHTPILRQDETGVLRVAECSPVRHDGCVDKLRQAPFCTADSVSECSPDPLSSQPCNASQRTNCKRADKPPCCRSLSHRLDEEGKCACRHASDFANPEKCSAQSAWGSNLEKKHGFSIFHAIVNSNHISKEATAALATDGSFTSLDSALAACSKADKCHGVMKVSRSGLSAHVSEPDAAISAKVSRLRPKLVLPISAMASVTKIEPAKDTEYYIPLSSNLPNLLSHPEAILGSRASGAEGRRVAKDPTVTSTPVFIKECKKPHFDPAQNCTQCIPPYVKDPSGSSCVCPAHLDPSTCDPSVCVNDGLDPASGCKACKNPLKAPNSSYDCVCDPSNPRINHMYCGEKDGSVADGVDICAPGSGLLSPDCKMCALPTAKTIGDHFTDVSDSHSLLATNSEIEKMSIGEDGDHSPCLIRCFASTFVDPTSKEAAQCRVVDVDAASKTCTLHSRPPVPSSSPAAVPDSGVRPGRRRFVKKDVYPAVLDEESGACGCVNGQRLQANKYCKCEDPSLDPWSCKTRSGGSYQYNTRQVTFDVAQVGMLPGHLAAIRSASEQEKLTQLLSSPSARDVGSFWLNCKCVKVAYGPSAGRHVLQWHPPLPDTAAGVGMQPPPVDFFDIEKQEAIGGEFMPALSRVNIESDIASIRSGVEYGLGVRLAGASLLCTLAPTSQQMGGLYIVDSLLTCASSGLDPATDCKRCRTSGFRAVQPLPGEGHVECVPIKGVNPEWTDPSSAPPVVRFKDKVPSTLAFHRKQVSKLPQGTLPQVMGAMKLSASDTNSVRTCADHCHDLNKKINSKTSCVGFMMGSFSADEYEGVQDGDYCLFLSNKDGLGHSSSGTSLAAPSPNRDTYLLKYCDDLRKEYNPAGPNHCSEFGGNLDAQGHCNESYAYSDPWYCESFSQCESSGIETLLHNPNNSGKCKRGNCIPGVESSSNGSCDKCRAKFTNGDRFGDLTRCNECQSNHNPFEPAAAELGDYSCSCKPIFKNRDPSTNCAKCIDGYYGLECGVTKEICSGNGVPTESATEAYKECRCDQQKSDNKGSFSVHFDGQVCDKCAEGYGPSPKVGGHYACSINLKDTRCGRLDEPLPLSSNVNPHFYTNGQLDKINEFPCDCDFKNDKIEKEDAKGRRGHFSGPTCELCSDETHVSVFKESDVGSTVHIRPQSNGTVSIETSANKPPSVEWSKLPTSPISGTISDVNPNTTGAVAGQVSVTAEDGTVTKFYNPTTRVKEFGGKNCNLPRSVCNGRGLPTRSPSSAATEATDKECECDGDTNFRSGKESLCSDGDCNEGWYGKLCNLPSHSCGKVFGHTFGPDAAYSKAATPDNLHCQCDSPDLMTGLSYTPGSAPASYDGQDSHCVCPDPLVLLSSDDHAKSGKWCVHKYGYCHNRGEYDRNRKGTNGKMGSCHCEEGYTGDTCDVCAAGFANILGAPLDSEGGKCTLVAEYCNNHHDPSKGVSGWDDVNQRCHCTLEYDSTKDATCRAPFCAEGFSPFSGKKPKADGTLGPEDYQCVGNRDACGSNARSIGHAIVNNMCVCGEDPNTGQFYVGNRRPFGFDGKTIDPTPLDPAEPSMNDVCQYGPRYCNYPSGTPADDSGACKCVTEGVYAAVGERCTHTRTGTKVNVPPQYKTARLSKARRDDKPVLGGAFTPNVFPSGAASAKASLVRNAAPPSRKNALIMTKPAVSLTVGNGCYNRGRPSSSSGDSFGYGKEWRRVAGRGSGKKMENKKLSDALSATRKDSVSFSWEDFADLALDAESLDEGTWTTTKEGSVWETVPSGKCECDTKDANGNFCQYTFKRTCNGKGIPNFEGKCAASGKKARSGEAGNCEDGYSGFDCSVEPLGVPDCPFQSNCVPGCKAEHVPYNRKSGTHSNCSKSRSETVCCAGASDCSCHGCGWFKTPTCDKDPNLPFYPCICTGGKPAGSIGDKMIGSGVSHEKGMARGWRAKNAKNASYTFKEAVRHHRDEIRSVDATYVPHVDLRQGY